MGTLKSSKSYALAANQGTKEQKGQSSNNNSKDKKQNNSKEKKDQTSLALKATNETQSSKGDKPKKERVQCTYSKRPGHDEHKCLKKQIDQLTHILEKNNISVPESIKQSSSEGSNKAKENSKGKGKGYPDGVKGYRLLHPTTHELLIERSVQFEEGSSSSLSTTSPTPSTLALESLGIHDSSSDESNSPEQSSTSTSDAESDSKDSPPSSPSHHSEVDDSPSFSPLWARQTLQSVGDWVGDPSDTR
ncbi:suppressor protein SRP40-like [Cryptomeria japonica]|uniref:suppressor protein SRP40-like n=1 Tax=Cryptomeria japonica TaxID=3369 RepID=UPI0027DA6369|nr:suppressor protein SRP40-like [Cryptomeria japonica]